MKAVAVAYAVAAAAIFALNWTSGPVTTGLAAARAVAWPLWLTTGIPQGVRFAYD